MSSLLCRIRGHSWPKEWRYVRFFPSRPNNRVLEARDCRRGCGATEERARDV